MLIARAAYPVRTLGYGVRAALWTQGCTIQCSGCVARDTWNARSDAEVSIPEILAWLQECPDIDGITISGGEPLDQVVDLVDLLEKVRAVIGPQVDVLCFSGRTRRAVESAFPRVLELVDALVVGPFVSHLESAHPLMGSGNQELIVTTKLGQARYGSLAEVTRRPLQISTSGQGLTFVGIPNAGDLAALAKAAAKAGLHLEGPSWQREDR